MSSAVRSDEMGRVGEYFPGVISAVGDVLEGSYEGTFLFTALELLAAGVGEALDLAGRDRVELGGEEVSGEGGVRVEGVNVDEAVVYCCHC